LRYELYEGRLRSLDRLDDLTLTHGGVTPVPALSGDEPAEEFALRFRGFVSIEEAGVFEFELVSDDGSRLWLADTLVIDHDGLHSARGKRGMVALAAGIHPIRVEYFQAGGGQALELRLRRSEEEEWRGVDGTVYYGR
ncbi:MAG: PA14 domain-containing protein, partial [Gemmatimonadales bacterium]